MTGLKRIAAVGSMSLASDALLLFGGMSFGRLNVPGTTAGATDYGLWVALPVVAALAIGAVGRFVGFIGKVTPDAGPANTSSSIALLGKEAGRLAADGKTDLARHLLEAADKIRGAK